MLNYSLEMTDALIVSLQSFSSNRVYYTIPESARKGVPLFYLPPNSPQPVRWRLKVFHDLLYAHLLSIPIFYQGCILLIFRVTSPVGFIFGTRKVEVSHIAYDEYSRFTSGSLKIPPPPKKDRLSRAAHFQERQV